MAQTRNIYITGNPLLDRFLQDIASRLDTVEGLRPDLVSGLYTIDEGKAISTTGTAGYQTVVDGVDIEDNAITLTSGTFTCDESNIVVTESSIEIKDENGTTIHKME